MLRLQTSMFLGLLASSCARLPDQVPMEASLTLVTTDSDFDSALHKRLAGAELLLGGEVIATFVNQIIVKAQWTMPKAEAIAALKQTFTLRMPGTCGPVTFEVKTSPSWQAMPESELARAYSNMKVLPLFFDLPLVKGTKVFVDTGTSSAPVRVGELEVALQPRGAPVLLAGCPDQVPVRVGEEQVGFVDSSLAAAVVSSEPGVCYEFGSVLYGDTSAAKVPSLQRSNKERVWNLSVVPERFLERAESSVKAYGKGAVITQVVRVACPR